MIDATKVIKLMCNVGACGESYAALSDISDMEASWNALERPEWMLTWLRIIDMPQATLDLAQNAFKDVYEREGTMEEAAAAIRAAVPWNDIDAAAEAKYSEIIAGEG